MLVLSRYNNQSIMIGDDIEIRVIAVHTDKVTLGISAPRRVPVHRKELFDRLSHDGPANTMKAVPRAAHKARRTGSSGATARTGLPLLPAGASPFQG